MVALGPVSCKEPAPPTNWNIKCREILWATFQAIERALCWNAAGLDTHDKDLMASL